MAFQNLTPWNNTDESAAARKNELRSTPATLLSHFNQNVEQIVDAFWRNWPMGAFEEMAEMMPMQANIEETDKAYTMTLRIPGMQEQELEISVKNGVLNISGRHESNKREDNQKVQSFNRQLSQFQRMLALPFNADESKIEATFQNGVLTVTIPKMDKENERQTRIPLNAKKKAAA